MTQTPAPTQAACLKLDPIKREKKKKKSLIVPDVFRKTTNSSDAANCIANYEAGPN